MTATAAPLAVKGLIDSSALFKDTAALKAQLSEQGYLYLRGSGPRAEILELRRQILEICKEAGWLDAKAPLMEGRWSGVGPFTESEPVYMAVYKKMLNLPLFNDLPGSKFYMDLFERLLGGKPFNHKMHIGRVSFPNNVVQTTPPHQDFHYIAGSADTYTVWTPIGDIPLSVGGLAVLAKSHKKGFLTHKIFPEHKYAGSGMDEGMIRESLGGLDWHTGDFTAGDVLLFHSHTIHKAMPNVSGNILRLSCDNRYQLDGTVTGPAAHRTHHNL
jgi:hypothetical protein